MGGVINSIGGFLGTSSGPQVTAQTGNPFLQQMQDYINNSPDNQATGATTGSQYATDQVTSNPLFSQSLGNMQTGLNQIQDQLHTGQGLEGQQTGILNNLQSQGFNLTPQDQTLYGQTSGDIARQFGQTGNQISNDLAMRGLASAPSGAAGASFSGLAGNQNEALAQAQQSIMQQRYQNTMNQIQQQQNFINSLNSQNNQAAGMYSTAANNQAGTQGNLVSQQYQRQLQGAQNHFGNMATGAGLQNQANQTANQGNLGAAQFNADNKPANFMDYSLGGMGSSLYNFNAAPGKGASSLASSGGSAAGLFAGG